MKKNMILMVSLSLLFICCNDDQNSTVKTSHSLSDSLSALREVSMAYKQTVKSCEDSLSKYKLFSINDTCVRYLYVVNGTGILSKHDSLIVPECAIKLTRFEKLSNHIYHFHYHLFIQEMIPVNDEFTEGQFIYALDYDTKTNQVIKSYEGQETTYMDGVNFKSLYDELLHSSLRKELLLKRKEKLNPEVIRLGVNRF